MKPITMMLGAVLVLLSQAAASAPDRPADVVVTGARIYTQGPGRHLAQAMAIRDGRIIAVGTSGTVKRYIGPATRHVRADGKLVLPGLIDSHIHPLDTIEFDACSLQSKARTLAHIADIVRACITDQHVPAGHWVRVSQWEMTAGNAPDAQHPDLRSALDAASTNHPIIIVGWDGHHSGFNSAGLALAHDRQGRRIGITRATLAREFADLTSYVGVRANGEPNGVVNDRGKQVIDTSSIAADQRRRLLERPYLVADRLNSAGITGAQDAAVRPASYPIYDALLKSGRMSFRLNMAQLFEPEAFRNVAGEVDYARLFAEADAVRARYAGNPLVKADALKVFADGVVESDPTSVPPTLGNSPRLTPYLQPIFRRNAQGHLTIDGYVDPASAACGFARSHPEELAVDAAVQRFMRLYGFHPAQCTVSYGVPQHEPAIFADFVREAHLHDYTLHIHTISDAAVRMAVDAIEAARAAGGRSGHPDTLAHVELANPADIARAGRNHLFIAWTFSWIYAEPEGFDLSLVPFYNRVSGTSFAELHAPNSAFERDYYPVKAAKDAGAITVAGSDAPVLTTDPQPFVNMEFAITRAKHGLPPTSPWQRLTIREVLDAYTIDGARALGRERDIGSLEVGKSADFIIVDQDVFALADGGHPDRIGQTKVLSTWFMGKEVYRSAQAM